MNMSPANSRVDPNCAVQALPFHSSTRRVILSAPYAKLHIDARDFDDHIVMRAEQLSKLLDLMAGASKNCVQLNLAKQQAREVELVIFATYTVAGPGRPHLVREEKDFAGRARRLSDLLLALEDHHPAGGLLWLAQQIADEISEMLEGAPN